MATKVKSLFNKSNVMIPVVLVEENVTVHLPPGQTLENVNIENWHSINKYCKTIQELGEVNPSPNNLIQLND